MLIILVSMPTAFSLNCRLIDMMLRKLRTHSLALSALISFIICVLKPIVPLIRFFILD